MKKPPAFFYDGNTVAYYRPTFVYENNNIVVKDCINFDRELSGIENAAVMNYLNETYNIGLDKEETPLVYDPITHSFYEKDLEGL